MDALMVTGLLLTAVAAVLAGPQLFQPAGRPLLRALPAALALLAATLHALRPVTPVPLCIALLSLAISLRTGAWRFCREGVTRQLLEQEQLRRRESEEKYRKIFEGSENIILLLDTSFRIREANLSVKRILGKTHASVVNASLFELFDGEEMLHGSADMGKLVLEERLAEFLVRRRPAVFTLSLRQGKEILSFRCGMEFLGTRSDALIMATLTPIDIDHLTEFLVREEQEHEIDNRIMTVDEICKRLTRNLIRYTTPPVKNQILLGLREIVLNAMEHGNLEIDYRMKTEALEKREYMTLLKERQNDPRYSRRRIRLRYILDPDQVTYIITDEGKGFDHGFFKGQKHYKNKGLLLHGRGIMISTSIFDQVRYNKKGNEVRLTKRL